MRKNILILLFLLSVVSCNTYPEYFFSDNSNKNNYQIKLLNKNQSVIYLIDNNKKKDSVKVSYEKNVLKLKLSKIKLNSFTKSNRYVNKMKKIKTISFGEGFSNNSSFKHLELKRFAIIGNNLSVIDSIWFKNSEDNNILR